MVFDAVSIKRTSFAFLDVLLVFGLFGLFMFLAPIFHGEMSIISFDELMKFADVGLNEWASALKIILLSFTTTFSFAVVISGDITRRIVYLSVVLAMFFDVFGAPYVYLAKVLPFEDHWIAEEIALVVTLVFVLVVAAVVSFKPHLRTLDRKLVISHLLICISFEILTHFYVTDAVIKGQSKDIIMVATDEIRKYPQLCESTLHGGFRCWYEDASSTAKIKDRVDDQIVKGVLTHSEKGQRMRYAWSSQKENIDNAGTVQWLVDKKNGVLLLFYMEEIPTIVKDWMFLLYNSLIVLLVVCGWSVVRIASSVNANNKGK